MSYYYIDGEMVVEGDQVLVNGNRKGTVSWILTPNSEQSYQILHPEGGFFIEFESGGLELWHEADEDIVLLNRKVVQV